MRKILLIIVLGILVLFSPSFALAEEVNSYELFWPISAGRVMGDSLYGLKTFKEKIRGAFIFGKYQRANYSLFLATKRSVEAEKLIGEGKNELAGATLEKASDQLKSVSENISLSTGLSKESIDGINGTLDKLEVFFEYLATKSEPLKGKIQTILKEIEVVNKNI